MRLPLSENQQRVYDFVASYIEERDYPPLLKEIQDSLHLTNPGAVHKCLKALETKGWIRREKGKHRGIRLKTLKGQA